MAKATQKTEAKTVTVQQIGSPIRRPAEQRATLIGLGLNKLAALMETSALRWKRY